MIADREAGRSETRDEFDKAREDDPSIVHENAHLRTEDQIDRSEPSRQPANTDKEAFKPELARNGQLKAEFAPAREDDASVSHQMPQRDDRGDSGSQMVKDEQPRPELKPPEHMSKPTDRQTFAERWADEMKRSGDYHQKSDAQDGNVHDRSHEQDRGEDRTRER